MSAEADDLREIDDFFAHGVRELEPTDPDFLGSGGYGQVCRLSRTKAIKLFFSRVMNSPNWVDAEKQASLARLVPASVNMMQAGKRDGHEYIVMELLNGCSLDDIGPHAFQSLRNDVRYRIALDLVEINCQLQDARIGHRDIKPPNLFLDAKGQLRLIDFDTLVQFPPTINAIKGRKWISPHYGAPEMAHEIYTSSTDLYVTGVTLFELTERLPLYVAMGCGERMDLLKMLYGRTPKELQPYIDKTIDDFVSTDHRLRALLKKILIVDPNRRPRPAELRSELWSHAADRDTVIKDVSANVPKYAQAIKDAA